VFAARSGELDTIVACATARAPGARAVLRISGRQALELAQRVFRPHAGPLNETAGSSVTPGALVLGSLEVPAHAWVFRAPRSYTGEHLVELHLPSSAPLVDATLEVLCAAGARPAQPGEFTRRAFLEGKLDLTRAEAVQTLSEAATADAARAGLRQLRGGLSAQVGSLREDLLSALSRVEAALDFAHEDLEEELIADAGIEGRLRSAQDAVHALLAREAGTVADEGALRVCLFGPPNAGKSSLLNRLAGRDAALVSSHAGTTRDALTETIPLGPGLSCRVTDLAGFGTSLAAPEAETCTITQAAEASSREALVGADVALLVLDGSTTLSAAALEAARAARGRTFEVVFQKSDLDAAPREGVEMLGASSPPISVSARTGEGIGDLLARLREHARGEKSPDHSSDLPAAPNARHRVCLRRADEHLLRALAGLAARAPTELVAIDLKAALDAIEEITGSSSNTEDVLDRVFSTFCLGK
jgi:tRNA modification GTPase